MDSRARNEIETVRTGDGSHTLHHPRYAQTFHSHHGALREARHVFLEATGVAARLSRGEPTRVLEVGFGTGLNALVTADEALAVGGELTFVSLEKELLPLAALDALDHRRHLEHVGVWNALRAGLASGSDSIQLAPGIGLELVLGPAEEAALPSGSFHALYQDAFSPDANPELWTVPFFRRLHAALAPAGVLTTYSAKGDVRRGLAEAGFAVERLPGPPGKHHMTRARRES